jgi:hypothetical protein
VEPGPQTPRERALLLLRALVPYWRSPTGNELVWTLRIVVLVAILLAIGAPYNKTLWDWLQLLIVPAALAVGGFWLNRAQSEREQAGQDAQRERERDMEELQRRRELEVQNERAQDTALDAYLDKMDNLLDRLRTAASATTDDHYRERAQPALTDVLIL